MPLSAVETHAPISSRDTCTYNVCFKENIITFWTYYKYTGTYNVRSMECTVLRAEWDVLRPFVCLLALIVGQ
jgi:hypothetical protein